jgi:hypothetical protein
MVKGAPTMANHSSPAAQLVPSLADLVDHDHTSQPDYEAVTRAAQALVEPSPAPSDGGGQAPRHPSPARQAMGTWAHPVTGWLPADLAVQLLACWSGAGAGWAEAARLGEVIDLMTRPPRPLPW